MEQRTYRCRKHGEFTITEEQDKDISQYHNYECPTCDEISPRDKFTILLKGLPNTKG